MRFIIYSSYLMYLSIALFITGCASFELETNQEGVSIIDEQGNSIGTAPYNFEQFSGERVFTLRKPGYVDKKITISSLDKKVIDVDLESELKKRFSIPFLPMFVLLGPVIARSWAEPP